MSSCLDEVQKSLLGLGNSPFFIATSLDGQNLKGYKLDVSNCPISNFLEKNFPKHRFYTTYLFIVCVEHNQLFDIPRSVLKFLKQFDEGNYPGLVN